MKALVKTQAKPGIWLEDVPKPTPTADEVLIKVNKSAICGTDMHIYQWGQWAQNTITTPVTIGHEFVGEIAALGSAINTWKVGQRVSAEGHINCGVCRQCRTGNAHICPKTIGIGVKCNGAFAEYVAVPAKNLIAIPEDISDDYAAVLDPLGNAVHSAFAFNIATENVLITGAGPVGLLATAVAKYAGAHHIVISDYNEERLAMAQTLGATHTISLKKTTLSDALKALKPQVEFPIGLEMSGAASALTEMLQNIACGGKIALLGVPENPVEIDFTQVIFKGLTLQGIYGRKMFSTWYHMIALLQSGLDIKAAITHHFPANDYQVAFDTMASGKSGKIILDWSTIS